MIARTITGALDGIEAYRVDVEVALSRGLPVVHIIGLPDGAVREAKVRIENALRTHGLPLPNKRITLSLAPCGRRKSGSGFDLPLAVALLSAMEIFSPDHLDKLAFCGELALDGALRPVSGVLALTAMAKREGLQGIVVPCLNAEEAAVVRGISVFPVSSLSEAVALLAGKTLPEPFHAVAPRPGKRSPLDLADVRGQAAAVRALTVAAAGGHHLMMIGPPGAGKTMLARRLPGLLPPLTPSEALETTKIYSAAGLLGSEPLIRDRPFRAPHHTATTVALVGGGSRDRLHIGEVSLAHHGVLFLDEATEMARGTLDALREPLEAGQIVITRAERRAKLPAQFQLVLALNPCPCGKGWEGSPQPCQCPPNAASRYLGRISGPLLDRIDLQIALRPVPFLALEAAPTAAPSASLKTKVVAARKRQHKRFRDHQEITCNAMMDRRTLDQHCLLEGEARTLLMRSADRFALSARAVHRVLRVARTIADLEAAPSLALPHIAEALAYRSFDHADPNISFLSHSSHPTPTPPNQGAVS